MKGKVVIGREGISKTATRQEGWLSVNVLAKRQQGRLDSRTKRVSKPVVD